MNITLRTAAALLGLAAAGLAVPAASQAKPAPRAAVDSAFADLDLESVTEARSVVAAIIPADRQEAYFGAPVERLMDQLRANASRQGIDPGLRQVIEDFIQTVPARLKPVTDKHRPVILDAMARAMAHDYSLDELKQLHAFAETPAGGRYLSHSDPQFADAALQSIQHAYVQDLSAEAAKLRPEMLEKVNTWLAAHPEVLARPERPAAGPEGR